MDSSFCARGVSWKRERKKSRENKWFSVWMDLSETISSVYTPAVGTRRAWASWPAGSGGDGALWVTSVHKWLPIRKGGGRGRERGWEEAQYFVLLNLWEDVDDTRRHQLNTIRISGQFAGAERGEGRWANHPVYQFLSGRRGLLWWMCQPAWICESNVEKSSWSR